ncbi:MAG: O-antigen ligase family protein, partial [Planctomycetota bacterium]|nr:O-antigen ligase family protein [Planctomycetota bacterium]
MAAETRRTSTLDGDAAKERLRRTTLAMFGAAVVCLVTARVLVSADFSGLGANLFLAALFAFALIPAAVLAVLDRELTLYWAPLGILPVLVVAAVLVSPAVAGYKYGAFGRAVPWLLQLAFFFVMLVFASKRGAGRTPVRLALCALFAAAAGAGLIGVFQWSFGFAELQREVERNPAALTFLPAELLHEFQVRLGTNEPFACFANPNSLAAFLALMTAPLIGAAMAGWKAPGKAGIARVLSTVWLCLVAAMFAFVLGLTGSKGGLGALCVSVVVFAVGIWIRRRRKALIVLASLGLVAVLAIVGLAWLRNYDPLELKNPASSMGVRVGYWKAACRIVEERPLLGGGLDSFSGHFLRFKDAAVGEALRAHNDYLDLAVELGVPAALVFLAFWVVLIWKAFRPGPDASAAGAGTGGASCASEPGGKAG